MAKMQKLAYEFSTIAFLTQKWALKSIENKQFGAMTNSLCILMICDKYVNQHG